MEGRGQIMPGSKIGRLCDFLPSALCLGDLWLQPGKRTAGAVGVGPEPVCGEIFAETQVRDEAVKPQVWVVKMENGP